MANQPREPSLVQARTNHHIHNHNHIRDHNQHHRHHHRHLHITPDSPHARSDESLDRRQLPDLESVITEVVQTVSVIQYIDGAGSTVGIQTILSNPVTQLVDQPSGITLDSSVLDSVLSTLDVPGVTSLLASETPTESTPESTETPLTSAPSSLTSFPPYASIANSSTTNSSSIFTNSTLRSLFANTTTSSLSSSTPLSLPATNTSTWLTSLTESATSTETDLGNGGAATAGTAPSSPTSSTAPSATPGPPPSTVVAGVVGGLAGVAILVFVLLFLVKWKRRHDSGLQLLSDGNGSRGTFSGPSGGSGPMSERSLPFAIPAALATLTGQRRSSQTPSSGPDSPERGFQRISGRKLTSVLQTGGDGYSDPHDSLQSGTSFYRDSQGFHGGQGSSTRLQLGSPMRPDSGIPIMRTGPARTPVTEQGPFDTPRELTPTRQLTPTRTPIRDPISRSHASQDGSRVSSKFTENI